MAPQRHQSLTMSAAGNNANALTLENLTRRYGAFVGVDDLTLSVGAGELLGLLGPSGCGKTTTLRMIAGLIEVSAGRIVVGGRDVTALPTFRRNMGVVFQNYALFPHMTIADNVAFGLEMRAVPASEIGRRVEAALAMVHLEGRDRRRPSQLSGGQQQRVALARALVVNPSILLLDEPLSNLDAKLRDEMRNEIRAIQQRLGITTVFVTHDQTEALAMCDKIAVMNAGRLVQIGTPCEIYERPSDPFVASFVGRVNRLGGAGGTSGTYRVGEAHLVGQRQLVGAVEIMIRPHRIGLLAPDAAAGEGRNFVPGRIARVAYIGDLLQIEAETPCGTLLVEHATKSQGLPPRPGDAVGLAWSPADTMVFPRGGG